MKKTGAMGATLAMLISSFVWGASFVSMKICYQWFTPYSMLKYRLLISAAVMALILVLGKRSFKLKKKDIPRIFVCGALGVFAYYLLELISIQWMSASSASILVGAIPVVSLLATALVSRARMTRRTVVSAVLSTVGILVVTGLQSEPITAKYLLGVLLMLGAILSWVVYGFLSVDLMGKYDGIVVTFYQIAAGALLSVVCFPTARVSWQDVGLTGLFHMLFLGAIGSGICYLLYNKAVQVLDVTVTNTLMNLVPLVTIIVEMIAFRTVPGIGTFLGGGLIVLAAMIAVSGRPAVQAAETEEEGSNCG